MNDVQASDAVSSWGFGVDFFPHHVFRCRRTVLGGPLGLQAAIHIVNTMRDVLREGT